MTTDIPDVRVYEQCPFCQEEQVDTAHLTACSLRDAEIITAAQGDAFPQLTELFSTLCKAKTLCDTFEALPEKERATLWCCQDCYAFGDGAVPDLCPECRSFNTSPARIFMEDTPAS